MSQASKMRLRVKHEYLGPPIRHKGYIRRTFVSLPSQRLRKFEHFNADEHGKHFQRKFRLDDYRWLADLEGDSELNAVETGEPGAPLRSQRPKKLKVVAVS